MTEEDNERLIALENKVIELEEHLLNVIQATTRLAGSVGKLVEHVKVITP